MERRNFMKLAGVLAAAPALSIVPTLGNEAPATGNGKEIYEWRIYTLTGDGKALDNFFMDALIPAFNRKGVKVGAFKLFKREEAEKRHLVFIYPDIATYLRVKTEIWNDATFKNTAQGFYDTSAPNPVYSNFETFLCEAFSSIPVHRNPDISRTLLELRIYWSPNEEANKRKVKMFNDGEIGIFDNCGINSVLYGDILAGPRMPALMYLTWYQDESTRAEAWGRFVAHPDWLTISKLPEYAYTATNNTSTFLAPLPFSQL
ncbi:MAG: NIPSNAP family protein [Tannerella sp.]|jgi:hypothetical protein|nr:NIPSNAP family protein [Tannerella sp.]